MSEKNTFDATMLTSPLHDIKFLPTHEYDIKILCAPEMLGVKLRAFAQGVVITRSSPGHEEEFHPWHQVVRIKNGRKVSPELPPIEMEMKGDPNLVVAEKASKTSKLKLLEEMPVLDVNGNPIDTDS